jgi:hypothetical protein
MLEIFGRGGCAISSGFVSRLKLFTFQIQMGSKINCWQYYIIKLIHVLSLW